MMKCSVPKYMEGTVQGCQMKALTVPSKLIVEGFLQFYSFVLTLFCVLIQVCALSSGTSSPREWHT